MDGGHDLRRGSKGEAMTKPTEAMEFFQAIDDQYQWAQRWRSMLCGDSGIVCRARRGNTDEYQGQIIPYPHAIAIEVWSGALPFMDNDAYRVFSGAMSDVMKRHLPAIATEFEEEMRKQRRFYAIRARNEAQAMIDAANEGIGDDHPR